MILGTTKGLYCSYDVAAAAAATTTTTRTANATAVATATTTATTTTTTSTTSTTSTTTATATTCTVQYSTLQYPKKVRDRSVVPSDGRERTRFKVTYYSTTKLEILNLINLEPLNFLKRYL